MQDHPFQKLLWRRAIPRLAAVMALLSALLLSFGFLIPSTVRAAHLAPISHVVVKPAVKHDVSPPLRSIKPVHHAAKRKDMKLILPKIPVGAPNDIPDHVQNTQVPATIPSPSVNFNGVGNGFTGPGGTFVVNLAPPDTNGAVGPHHFVQIVNAAFAVFDKAGTVLFGPTQNNTLWSGFGGLCEADNDGDPIVLYDSIADRWLITQFAITNPNPNYFQCIAVSTTGDPTGSYNRYAFSYTNLPDYGKFGLWPDAYYGTFNMFNASLQFVGAQACAFDRASMLIGAAATQQCFNVGGGFGSLLPSTLDGSMLPPTGSPNYLLALNTTSSLGLWKFHVDFTTPANSTFTGPTSIPVSPFSLACGGGTCIPQLGTANQLDSLGDRLMYRLAYRNFGDHESLVVDHSVTAGSSVGMRWYEIRSPGGTPTVFQSGTYAPDANFRWMGSIAQDKAGDIAMGFSTSSSSAHPGISYTGRLVSDPLGTMAQGEASLIVGAGSQTNNLHRWGDYSSMVVDPSDDCTFWYTNEYIPADGSFNWKTQIGAFTFPSCIHDFSISANPANLTIAQGSSGTSTINTAVTSGSAGTINLTASVSPAGPTASLSPTSVTAGNSSTLTVNVGPAVAPGSYTVTVTGTEGSITHSTSVFVMVTASSNVIINGGFETGNFTGWTTSGTTSISTIAHSGNFSAMLGSTSPTNGNSSITQTFTAASVDTTLTFWYQVHCPDRVQFDWATATLRDNTTGTTRTVLPHTCTNNNMWVQVTVPIIAGHSYTLTLTNRDDNFPGDATFTLFDDVSTS